MSLPGTVLPYATSVERRAAHIAESEIVVRVVRLVEVDGDMVPYRPAMARFTAPVNHLKFPALALPIAGSGTPPASLQLIGAPWLEHHLLEIGRALEAAGIVAVEQPPLWRAGSTA